MTYLVRVASAALMLVLLVPTAQAQGVFGDLEKEAPPPDSRKAFVIGINAYDDGGFGPLKYAQRDAERLAEVLQDPMRGGFGAVEVATRGDLSARGLVARLTAWAETLGPQDLALVYFSGHGTRKLDERGRSRVYLATTTTEKDRPESTAIPLSAMQEFMETLPTTRRVLVVDACFTGEGKVAAATADAVSKALVDETMPFADKVAEKEAQLFATTYGRPALELDQLEHGVYTHFFIDALGSGASAADINQDGVISVSEAHDYARDGTLSTTADVQIPMAFYKIVGNEELFLSGDPTARKDARLALITSYAGPQEGMVLLIDGEEKGAFPRTVAIEPGKHSVAFRNTKGQLIEKGRMNFKDGQSYDVAKIRRALNGGRHLLSLGYAHSWVPGAQFKSDAAPNSPGLRVGYALRFSGRNPVARVLGLGVDVTWGVFLETADDDGFLLAPATHLVDLGVGPTFRVPLGPVTLQLMPRFSGMLLLRDVVDQPYPPWLLGTVGADLSVAFHPHPRVGIKVHWVPAFTNAALDISSAEIGQEIETAPGWQPPVRFLNRIVGGIEIGL
ncbi:MAG: caspase family protein [Deltaproteobacteria bacterium]|nr:caspase family protein [Deltaproteobacteria bacterium]